MNKRVNQWLQKGDDIFMPQDNSKIIKTLPSGYYDIKYSDKYDGHYLFKKTLHLDDIVELPMYEIGLIIDETERFWNSEKKFKEYGFNHKRGCLIIGKAGVGKSMLLNLLAEKIINRNGIVMSINNAQDLDSYCSFVPEYLKTIEPDKKMIVFLEDIEGFCDEGSTEQQLLQVLDGIENISHVFYVATTNYPEQLKERILNRPNRFDIRIEIPLPDEKVRRFFIEKKLTKDDLKNINLDEWVYQTDGFTISHIVEVIKSVILNERSLDDTINRLREMETDIPSSTKFERKNKRSVGFNNNGKTSYGKEVVTRSPSSKEDCDHPSLRHL